MTKVSDVIEEGQDIPGDVIGMTDRDGDELVLNSIGHWHSPGFTDPATCIKPLSCGVDVTEYAPLTVTAVREPEPRTVRVTMALDIQDRDGKAVFSTYEGEIGSCDRQAFLDTVAETFGVSISAAADPSVLSLPQVPPGIVALVVQFKGQEIRFEPYAEGGWIRTDWEGESWDLPALLEEFGPARVVMREPRTWPRLDTISNDLKAVQGASGKVYHRSHFSQSVPVFRERGNDGDPLTGPGHMFYALQTFDGPLTEVFADEPGGEPR